MKIILIFKRKLTEALPVRWPPHIFYVKENNKL